MDKAACKMRAWKRQYLSFFLDPFTVEPSILTLLFIVKLCIIIILTYFRSMERMWFEPHMIVWFIWYAALVTPLLWKLSRWSRPIDPRTGLSIRTSPWPCQIGKRKVSNDWGKYTFHDIISDVGQCYIIENIVELIS